MFGRQLINGEVYTRILKEAETARPSTERTRS